MDKVAQISTLDNFVRKSELWFGLPGPVRQLDRWSARREGAPGPGSIVGLILLYFGLIDRVTYLYMCVHPVNHQVNLMVFGTLKVNRIVNRNWVISQGVLG